MFLCVFFTQNQFLKCKKIFHVSQEGNIKIFHPINTASGFGINEKVIFGINKKLLHNYLLPRM